MAVDHDVVKKHFCRLYDDLIKHEGYAELAVDIRILKRGQKEVVIRCGKQHRYVVNQASDTGPGEHNEPEPNHHDGSMSLG